MPDIYRSAASVMVFRKGDDGTYRILLLRKPRKRDAWQLPQGGVEPGETAEQAAMRELMEEAGLHDCVILGRSATVYQYEFPPSFRRFRPDNVRGQRIAFMFAEADAKAEVRVDGKEVHGFEWVEPGELTRYIKRRAYASLVRELSQEGIALLKETRGR